jgi:hypothetical protein
MGNKQDFLDQARATQVGKAITASASVKKQSAILAGITNQEALELSSKMKEGVGDYILLSLDGDDSSEATIPFRILSAGEDHNIKLEMMQSGLLPDQPESAYEMLYIIKRLSAATQPYHSSLAKDIPNQKRLTESEIWTLLNEKQVIALGILYNEFVIRHSPDIHKLTESEINQVVDAISVALDDQDPKLMAVELQTIFKNLESSAIFAVLIKCVQLLKTTVAPTDK